MRRFALILAAAALLAPQVAFAAAFRPGDQISDSNPQPVKIADGGSTQESFQLVSANTPAAEVTVYGGDYILSQTCSTYGTVILRVRGPDGTAYQTLITKTSSDTAGGTGLALGSFAKASMTVTGTTGCYAILARVPA